MSLTPLEQGIVGNLGRIHEMICRAVGDGPSRTEDIREATGHVHALQNMILAQSAAREYPDTYRLLGEVIPREHPDDVQVQP